MRLAGTFLLAVAAQRLRPPRPFDLLFIIGMWLQAWGNALRLFESIEWWDNLVHLVVPFSSVPVLYVLLARLGLLHREITGCCWQVLRTVGCAQAPRAELRMTAWSAKEADSARGRGWTPSGTS